MTNLTLGPELSFGEAILPLGQIFGTAVLCAWVAAPLCKKLAAASGLVARPNPLVKTHTRPTPYLGGLAVFAGFLASTLLWSASKQVVVFIILCGLMMLWGILDDRSAFSPRVKLLGQAALAAAAVVCLRDPDWPWWLYPPLFFWLLLATNAVNLVDVMDGLAGGLSAVSLASLAVFAFISGNVEQSAVCLALAGAVVGFLPANWNRASIFLGDAGSLFLGFAIGMVPLLAPTMILSGRKWLFVAATLLVPLFEVALLVTMRTRAGKPFWRGSRDHFALRLLHAGWPVKKIVVAANLAAGAACAAALAADQYPSMPVAAAVQLSFIGGMAIAGSALAKIRV